MTGNLNATSGHRPSKKGGEAATRTLNPEQNESKVKRGCEEMNLHFFTAPLFTCVYTQELFFFFLSELLFQTADLFHQLRQMRERCFDSPPLGVCPRRIAQIGAWCFDGADDACLASEDGIVTDGDMAIHAGLSGHDDVIADLSAAGDADLRAEEIVLADLDIMSQMAKVIDLGAAADDGVIHRTVVDGRAGADLDVVSDDSAAELTDVMVVACLISGEAEALTADDGMRTKDDAVA